MHSLTGLLAIFVVLAGVISECNAVFCYECNSGPGYEGEGCADPFTGNIQLTDCGNETTACRKITQDVEGDYRVMRSCAPTSKTHRCVDRTGTTKIKLRYCECEGDKCNVAAPRGATLVTSLVLVSMATLISQT